MRSVSCQAASSTAIPACSQPLHHSVGTTHNSTSNIAYPPLLTVLPPTFLTMTSYPTTHKTIFCIPSTELLIVNPQLTHAPRHTSTSFNTNLTSRRLLPTEVFRPPIPGDAAPSTDSLASSSLSSSCHTANSYLEPSRSLHSKIYQPPAPSPNQQRKHQARDSGN